MAKKRGLAAWALYDWANSSFVTVIQTFVFAAWFTGRVAESETDGSRYWGNTLGMASFLVALASPVLGAVADRSGRRKPWLFVFTTLCVVPTALLFQVRPDPASTTTALALVAMASVGAEMANVFYNAMLPDLAPPSRIGRWSGWGWALGYAGGLSCLVLALYGFIEGGGFLGISAEDDRNVRGTFVLTAAWYGLFALPLFLFTPDREPTGIGIGRAVREGLGQLRQSVRDVRAHAGIVRFLLARMLYADGLATLFVYGGVYASTTFGMDTGDVLKFGCALNVTAGIGAFAFAGLDDRLGPRTTILVSLACLMVSAAGILLVQSLTLFWVLGMVLGVFVGPVQAASRSFLSHVAPPELRTQSFGLYALSGKATSFLGPPLVGWVGTWSGSQRVGMSVVVGLLLAGFLGMLFVPRTEQVE